MTKSRVIDRNRNDRYKVDKYLDTSSRYKYLYRLITEDGEYQETAESYDIPVSPGDQYYEVLPGMQDRLDLVSHKYYGTPLLWWVIAEASGITNPMHVPVGTVLRIPPKTSLFGYGGVVL